MFTKILIANRGEIACRIIQTARRLGIGTVAVYSDADAGARHVRMADEAVAIGPAPARESYLVSERIIEAARSTGAQAIHPGYGFLSENEAFARVCGQAGLVFIGPPVEAIAAMGLKSQAKALMGDAGVPLTPGYHGADQAPNLLREQAGKIGYPVLIKASAGGGGKGMRLVQADADFDSALQSCKREAAASFGNDDVLVEKYIVKPRHIEVQVFGDGHGNYVHLFERDCSVQRRHQKVLEEAPAPGMTEQRRRAMGKAATDAARAVGYQGAGTVEFIVNSDGSFYFMEMNTRLQVEHPVTEMITGQDLVQWQLIVAAGGKLPKTQEQLTIQGHAIEARIYAENPAKGFLPSTGTLTYLRYPDQTDHVRVDTGVGQGDEISPHYDPMIAKLIVWGPGRESALALMHQSLARTRIVGVHNNVSFLAALVRNRSFSSADLDTGLIEREHDELFAPISQEATDRALLVAAAIRLHHDRSQARSRSEAQQDIWAIGDGWRLNHQSQRTLTYTTGDRVESLIAKPLSKGFALRFNERDHLVQVLDAKPQTETADCQLRLDGQLVRAAVVDSGEQIYVFLDGERHIIVYNDPLRADYQGTEAESGLTAPMPGKLIALVAPVGARVARGDPLLVIEAMKMEHTIAAPADGVINGFHFAVGDQLDEGAQLVDFVAEDQAV